MININIEEETLFIFNLSEEFFSNYIKNDYFIDKIRHIASIKDEFLSESISTFMGFLLLDDSVNYQYKNKL